jgi:hypothetical protein
MLHCKSTEKENPEPSEYNDEQDYMVQGISLNICSYLAG